MRRLIVVVMVTIALTASLAIAAVAATNPNGTGQPSQTCGSSTALSTPGMAASAPGSAFNPDGKAGTVYAGEQAQNSGNAHSVSQYDVACFQFSQSH
ncbi:MAG: adenylate cyclase [Actinomycetota bacterium]